jgi:hypothetical protein
MVVMPAVETISLVTVGVCLVRVIITKDDTVLLTHSH